MKIEVDRYSSEALDQLFNAILIEDWKNVRDEYKRIKKRIKAEQDENFGHVLIEDLKYNKKVKKAYETIIRYCLSHEESTQLLGGSDE